MTMPMDKCRALVARKDIWFDLIRIYVGVALFVRGLVFFLPGGRHALEGFLDQTAFGGWGMSVILGHYILLAHLAGGILLAVGLLTRLAAAVQIPILFGAVFFVHYQEGLFALGQSLELTSLVLFLLIVILVHGPGPLALDAYEPNPQRVQHPPGEEPAHAHFSDPADRELPDPTRRS